MKKCWKIRNEAGSAEEAELLIYGTISNETWQGDEVTPKQLHDELEALGGKSLCVRINSGGGDVFAATAIYNQLRTYAGDVTVRIDGLAASAATIVACVGSKVVMPRNALYMIHNPVMLACGGYDADGMRECADQLDAIKQTIVNTYESRSSLSEQELCEMMDAETWMTADEAREYGFVDEIDEKEIVTNRLERGRLIVNSVACDLGNYKNAAQLTGLLQKNFANNAGRKDGKRMERDLLEKIKNLLNVREEAPKPEQGEAKPMQAADGISQERERMLALDALDDHRGGAISKMVDEAKRNGTSAEQLKPFLDIARAQDEENRESGKAVRAIKDLIEDNMESGAAGVRAAVPEDKDMSKQAGIDAVVACANGK